MYVRAGRPAFARPFVGVHRSTSLMSSSPFLQQGPACLVGLTWTVFVMRGRWPYSLCLVGYWSQDLFNIARNILVSLPSSFFSIRLVSVQVVHPYSSIDKETLIYKGEVCALFLIYHCISYTIQRSWPRYSLKQSMPFKPYKIKIKNWKTQAKIYFHVYILLFINHLFGIGNIDLD